MRILFDHNVPRRFRRELPTHVVRTAREMGWEKLSNGLLLAVAAERNFDAFLSIDKSLEHEQNLKKLPLPVIVLDCISNALPNVIPFAPAVLGLLDTPLRPCLHVVKADGQVLRIG